MKSTAAAPEIKKSDFIFFSVLILFLALDLRLLLLSIKPFHNDEGVNAYFLLELLRHGKYVYDPENYHGPLIYFITAGLAKLLGLSDFSLRFSPVLFSIFQLFLLFLLKKPLKKIGLLTALVLMGFSPNIIYFARTFIHETYFTSLTLAAFTAFYFLLEKRNVRFLIPTALAVALMITTKETFVITLASWCVSAVLAWLITSKGRLKFDMCLASGNLSNLVTVIVYTGLSACFFLLIYLLLYSSFFTNPAGPSRALESLFRWEGRSRYDHVKEFFYYSRILLKYELPIFVLAALGAVYAFWRRTFFLVFVSTWTISIFLIYSFIPYKTPWLILNILLPAVLTAGAAVGHAINPLLMNRARKEMFALFLLIFILWPAALSIKVNFFRYDDDRLPMVYVQTDRSYKNLSPIWNILSVKYGDNTKTAILSPSYWPLPWTLRDHSAGYYARLVPNLEDHAFLIAEDTQRVETGKIYGETHHKLEMPFALHSGFDLYLWIRNDIWEDTFGDSTWRPVANSARHANPGSAMSTE